MGRHTDSMGEATIVVISKKDKDPLFSESYRPISLLPTDVKILAKVLVNPLNKVITHIIHPNQARFMPNKSTAIDIRRVYLNMQVMVSDR